MEVPCDVWRSQRGSHRGGWGEEEKKKSSGEDSSFTLEAERTGGFATEE